MKSTTARAMFSIGFAAMAGAAHMMACGTPTGDVPSTVAEDSHSLSLIELGFRPAGEQPILVAANERGIEATVPDGSWTMPLVQGAVDAAAFDASQMLLWFLRDRKLYVVDLRSGLPTSVLILEGLTGESSFAVEGTSEASTDNARAGPFPVLEWHRHVARVRVGSGAGASFWDEDERRAAEQEVKGVRVVGTSWLRDHRFRVPHVRPRRSAPTAAIPGVALADLGNCEDRDVCGFAQRFGDTGWSLVVSEHSCGDMCYTRCVLYDPARGQFSAPDADTRAWGATAELGPCEPYSFDSSGRRYLVGDKACTMERCWDVGRAAVGWLQPGGSTIP